MIPTLVSAQRRILDGEAVAIEIIIDISNHKEAERKLTAAALIDVLTGLPNRAAFDRHLGSEIATISYNGTLSLASIDLNGFKGLNHRHGHGVGAAFLRVIAQQLRSRSRVADFVGRIGGEAGADIMRRWESACHGASRQANPTNKGRSPTEGGACRG